MKELIQWIVSKNSIEEIKNLCICFGISLPGFRVGVINPSIRPRLEKKLVEEINMKRLIESEIYSKGEEFSLIKYKENELIELIKLGKKPSIVFIKLIEEDRFETALKLFQYFSIEELNNYENQKEPIIIPNVMDKKSYINYNKELKRVPKLQAKIDQLKNEIIILKEYTKQLKDIQKEELKILNKKMAGISKNYDISKLQYEEKIEELSTQVFMLNENYNEKYKENCILLDENQKLKTQLEALEFKRILSEEDACGEESYKKTDLNMINNSEEDSNINNQSNENLSLNKTILKEVKASLELELSNLTLKNIGSTMKRSNKYFRFLESLVNLPDELGSSQNLNDKTNTKIKRNETILEDHKKKKEKISKKSYQFERLLKGGRLKGINAFIPEWLVRDLSLSHGDFVFAEKQNDSGNPKYEYELDRAFGGRDPIDRIQITFAIVEYDETIKRLIVQKTADNELIRIDEVPQTIILPEDDIHEFNIKLHDIIDIALCKRNLQNKKVIWKYYSDRSIIHLSKQSKETKPKKEREQVEPIFEGKKILMIGYEPGKAAFRDEIEKRLGELLFLTGDEQKDMFSATIQKADAVIFMLEHVSHSATYYATNVCKLFNIPFKGIHSFGRTNFIRTAEELISFNQE